MFFPGAVAPGQSLIGRTINPSRIWPVRVQTARGPGPRTAERPLRLTRKRHRRLIRAIPRPTEACPPTLIPIPTPGGKRRTFPAGKGAAAESSRPAVASRAKKPATRLKSRRRLG